CARLGTTGYYFDYW
nr:immunoglobulin heavy chain junction region [Mus musculus]